MHTILAGSVWSVMSWVKAFLWRVTLKLQSFKRRVGMTCSHWQLYGHSFFTLKPNMESKWPVFADFTGLFTKPIEWRLLAIQGLDWYNSNGMENCPQAVNGGQMIEQSLKASLSTDRTPLGFVNSTINVLITQDFSNDKPAVISYKSSVMSYWLQSAPV